MKAVIYARYSSDNQREESIEGQLRDCNEYAKYNDITVVGSYIDRALSAKTDNRPEFQKMIKDSAKRLFDVIIVWKLDRFARNRFDSAYYKNVLKKNGVRVVSAKESISEGAEGIMASFLYLGLIILVAKVLFPISCYGLCHGFACHLTMSVTTHAITDDSHPAALLWMGSHHEIILIVASFPLFTKGGISDFHKVQMLGLCGSQKDDTNLFAIFQLGKSPFDLEVFSQLIHEIVHLVHVIHGKSIRSFCLQTQKNVL